MYIPPAFRSQDRALAWDLIEDIRLGCLITAEDGMMASHLPFIVERQGDPALIGHLARANPQWKHLHDCPVLVNFLGPNTHISPSWYATSRRAPTWNNVAVQVRGRAEVTEDRETLRSMVLALSAIMEPDGSMWKADELDQNYVDKLLPGIVGFRIKIDDVDVQLRLSQQNGPEDRARVRNALENGTERQRQVAAAMTRYLSWNP